MKVVSELFIIPRGNQSETLAALKKNGVEQIRPLADKIVAAFELKSIPDVYKELEHVKTISEVKDASIFSIQYYP